MLLEDALRALPTVEQYDGPVIDVGSGGGSPGLPLAAALPHRAVTLLEAEQRKCDFLRRWAPPNAQVVIWAWPPAGTRSGTAADSARSSASTIFCEQLVRAATAPGGSGSTIVPGRVSTSIGR